METQTTMKAYHLTGYGDLSENLKLVEVPLPAIRPGEVRIRVYNSAVNPVNWKLCAKPLPVSPALNTVPLQDFSGVVVGVHEDCEKGLKVGAPVYGYVPIGEGGTLAEYTCLPEKYVYPKPHGLSFEEAAAIPLVGCTAMEAVYQYGAVKKEDKVFVNGGSTSVGIITLQVLKTIGCEIATTCSDRTEEYMNTLGVNKLINYRKEKWSNILEGQKYTCIIDCIGDAWEDAKKILKPGGASRVVGLTSPTNDFGLSTIAKFGLDMAARKLWNWFGDEPNFSFFLLNASDPTAMLQLGEHIEEGKVKEIKIDEVFPFESAPVGVKKAMDGQVLGKVVFQVTKQN
eukprot:TRINITY_DN2735_c0_g1_i1.p1 TRINITY_DN2735_c0_g1~~TRINITY_DN2735_c0_g1_i1.p1  ORF type:complete len:359 (+),score=64.65 TRINITY_DN2735_c0_g1_i1:52-1077(+)